MQYIITIEKSNEFDIGKFDNAQEAFESAVSCSAGVVSSIIDDDAINVECNPPKIIISSESDLFPFSVEECKRKIKAAFTDYKGETYPEFSRVEVNSI